MNFVVAADFDLVPYSIPNLNSLDNGETIDAFVQQTQDEELELLLGNYFYTTMQEAMDALPDKWDSTVATVIGQQYRYLNDIWQALTVSSDVVPSEGAYYTIVEQNNRWLRLLNGEQYIVDKRKKVWKGLTVLVKPLVFSRWLTNRSDVVVEIGDVLPEHENSQSISPAPRIVDGYNAYAKIAGDKHCIHHKNT